MNFLDITHLNLPESIKDEMRIACLHGLDLSRYAKKYKNNPEHVREIRLLLQMNTKYTRYFDLPTEIIRTFRYYELENKDPLPILHKYITPGGNKDLPSSTLEKVLKANLKVPNAHIDFTTVRNDLVDIVLYGISKHIELADILDYAQDKRSDVIKLLITLRIADINIEPFLQDIWDEERILALIQGSLIVQPEQLIKNYNITPAFTASEITEVIQAHKVNPQLAQLIAYTEDDIPIYNAYQMHEIVEGYRLGLDFEQYYDPANTDLEMRQYREKLMRREEQQRGRKFRENLLKQIKRPLDPSLSTDWSTLIKEGDK